MTTPASLGLSSPDADLPALPGFADLPAPAVARGVADLPAAVKPRSIPAPAAAPMPAPAPNALGDFELDLPAPVGGGFADLPAVSKGAGITDLPAPARGLTDLPSPVGNRGITDLPAPAMARGVTDLPAVARGVTDLPRPVASAPSPGASLFELDDLPAPAGGVGLPTPVIAGLPTPKSSPTGLDDPFARASMSDLGGLELDLPAPGGGGGLPAPARSMLGRVALEKRAVPASLAPDLPARQAASLPTPVGGGGFGAGLPSPVGSALPATIDAGLPTPAAAGLPTPVGGGPGSFDLDFGPPGVTSGGGPLSGDSFDVPGPDASARRNESSGGMGFGEIDLGGGGRGDADEFDAIPMEKATGATPSGVVDIGGPSRPPIAASSAAVERNGSAKPQKREPKPGPRRSGLYAGLGIVGALVVGGAALSLTPAGAFGSKFIDEALHGAERRAAAQRAIDSARAGIDRDTYGAVRRSLRDLEAQLARTPNDAELLAYTVYAHYRSLARFGNDNALAGHTRTLFERLAAMPPAPNRYMAAARAARELATGHPERVRPDRDPILRDLATLALLESREPAEAVEPAREAAQSRPTPRTRFMYARALFLSDDREGARREVEEIISASAEHAGSRLVLAKLLAESSTPADRERALELARAVESMETNASIDERAEAAVLVGHVLLAREQTRQAREAFERAIALDPRSPAALVGAGTIHYQQSEYTDALARFQAAQTADPDDVDAVVGVAMTHVALQRPGDARSALEPALQAHGGDARLHFWLARALLAAQESDREGAERELREAIRLDSGYLEAYTTLASLLYQLQRGNDADEVLTQARAHVADQGAIHRALGEGRAQRGDLAGAERELREAVTAHPDDPRAHILLAQVLRRQRRWDEAGEQIEAVARLDANYAGLLLERGLLAEQRGDASSAVQTFSTALRANPTSEELTVRLASALVANGQNAEAESRLATFVVDHPNVAEAQYVLGRARLAQGNIVDAVRLLERSTELDATRADFRAYAAQANLARAQYTRALEHANQSVAIDPTYARGFAVRAEVKLRQGAVREALLDANEALRLDPTFAEANVTLADADEALGHAPEAIILYQRAIATQPNRGEWHARLARLLAEQGRTADALAGYQRAAGLGDALSPPPTWLAMVHRELGIMLRERNPREARQHFERFVATAPQGAPGIAEARQAIAELPR